ncbi:ABC transporter substrate-binding protein [Thalassobellus suaedae]|uniref:Helical backbone metal receptor n=1 Tax=Thalassobellus suaedae TaxID=3074124 RepID=A0ABY9Y4A7_9FLAO|nr:helical backbone metal receptor [Flavobacteriaceae bacterium HL-DH10]
MKIEDQLNRTIHLKEIPKRIISLVPSQTELLCDLGLKSALVGVTKFCVHPHNIKKEVTVVGGTKQIDLKKIKSLSPDIILCNKEENTKEIVEACELICHVHVSDIFTIEDSLELIKQYGDIFDRHKEAGEIIARINEEVADFKVFIKDQPTLKTAYFIWKKPYMVAGSNTFINYLLRLNKFENVYEVSERYPEVNLDKKHVNKTLQVVLLSSEPFPFKEKHKKIFQENYPTAKIVLADGEMFSWYGSRLLKAFRYFKQLRLNLHNDQLY